MKVSKRIKGYLGIFILIAQIINLIPPTTVHAQSSGSWSATIDFTTADGGWLLTDYNGTSGGWLNGRGWSSGAGGWLIGISKVVSGGDYTTYITSATIHVTAIGVSAADARPTPANTLKFNVNYSSTYNGLTAYPYSSGVWTFAMNNPLFGGTIEAYANTHDDGSGGYAGQETLITSIHITGTGTPPDLQLDPVAIADNSNQATCKTCVYNPIGDWTIDLPNLIQFAVCQLSNIFYCQIIPILLGMWSTIYKLLLYAQSVMVWVINTMQQFVNWTGGNAIIIARYGSGLLDNETSRVVEAIAWSNSNAYVIQSSNGAGFWDAVISLFNNLGSILNSIPSAITQLATGLYDLFGKLITAIRDLLSALIGGISGIAIALIYAFLGLVITVINAILWLLAQVFQLIAILPQFVGQFTAAYSEAISFPVVGPNDLFVASNNGLQIAHSGPQSFIQTPTTYVANCNNGIMFHVCLAYYVIDNTIYNNSGTTGLLSIFTPGLALTLLMIVAGVAVFIRWIKRLSHNLGFS